LRNAAINFDKKDKFRILCVGDSWTYGWGVSDGFTWPKQLEQLLKNRGITNIEIINCGQPGQYPTRYREKLEQLLPLLKPDLVLAGIHQLDDLAQLYEGEFKDGKLITGHHPLLQKSWLQKTKLFLKSLMDACFGNYLALKNKATIALPLQQKWKEEVATRINRMNLAEKLNYLNLDEPLRNYYETGNLNPALLYYYLDAPNRDLIFNQPEQTSTKFALGLLKKEMDAMKRLCAFYGSSFVFLNLPVPLFTGHTTLLPPSNTLQDYLLQNNRIDSMYKEVASASKVSYLELTQEFKQLNPKDAYFYKYDGHPTPKGYEVMAKSISEFLMQHQLIKLKE
jgi:lysophospholipase L1-like esterase